MEIELPFVCDDIFNNLLVPYSNIEFNFKCLELDINIDDYDDLQIIDENIVDAGDDEGYDGENKMDIICIFSIVLVRREKQAVVNKTIPKKMAVRG